MMSAISSVVFLLFLGTFCHAQDFGPWGNWTECSQTCGFGVQFSSRTCLRGRCTVQDIGRMRSCGTLPKCPIDGGWSDWSRWGRCSQSCGAGRKTRLRLCNNPRTQYNGKPCEGDRFQHQPCDLPPCPVDGGWGDWSEWGACTAKTCRRPGLRFRTRECNNPQPSNGGRTCIGGRTSSENCWRENCQRRINGSTLEDWSSVSSVDIDDPEEGGVNENPSVLVWSSSGNVDESDNTGCGEGGDSSSSSSNCDNGPQAPQAPQASQTTAARTTAPPPTPEFLAGGEGSSSSSSWASQNEENVAATTKKATTPTAAADADNGDESSSSSSA